MTAPYENAEFIELGTIMPPEKFRTVLPEDRDAPGGLTEQKVVIEFRRDYSDLLAAFTVLSGSNVRLRLFTQRKRAESFIRR